MWFAMKTSGENHPCQQLKFKWKSPVSTVQNKFTFLLKTCDSMWKLITTHFHVNSWICVQFQTQFKWQLFKVVFSLVELNDGTQRSWSCFFDTLEFRNTKTVKVRKMNRILCWMFWTSPKLVEHWRLEWQTNLQFFWRGARTVQTVMRQQHATSHSHSMKSQHLVGVAIFLETSTVSP